VLDDPWSLDWLDDRIEALVAKGRGRPVADALAYGASALGDHGLLWFLVGLARGRKPDRRRQAFQAVVYTGVISPVVNEGLKALVGRRRPQDQEPHRFPVRLPRSASFPSGHTLAAWCAATLLAEDDCLGPLYYGLAGLVSWSRLHVRLHHPTDVLGGALVGIALGHLGRRILE
jgi:undecaprenyl-diphosphatase